MTVTVEWIGQKVAEKKEVQLEIMIFRVCAFFVCYVMMLCVLDCVHSQRGQGVQRVECSRAHGGDLVVVERQEAH